MKEELHSSKDILINVESKEIRMAMMIHGQLSDFSIERRSSKPITGNIYKGVVTNILPNIQGAFVRIGQSSDGFIHVSDIEQNTEKFKEKYDLDFTATSEKNKKEEPSEISKHLKKGQTVLVQVVKEPIGSKGARLTSNIAIAGRYLVLLPNTPQRGVSRKIGDDASRQRLKKMIRSVDIASGMGLICRTVSSQVKEASVLQEEAKVLEAEWEKVREAFNAPKEPPYCLYEESDLVKRALMTAIDKGFDRLIFDDAAMYNSCKNLYKTYQTDQDQDSIKIELFKDKSQSGATLFERFGVERQLERATRSKVWLNNGGYLLFDQTEAMHTIDINSGRGSMRQSKEGQLANSDDLEESIASINVNAAEEIARQVRLRNLGGLIICDFIDMETRANQKRVLTALKNAMSSDFAKYTILPPSEFGLIEMTRQRNRESLHQTLFGPCPYCAGSGMVKNSETVLIDIERSLKKLLATNGGEPIELMVHPELEIGRNDKSALTALAKQSRSELNFTSSDLLHLTEYKFYSKDKKELLLV